MKFFVSVDVLFEELYRASVGDGFCKNVVRDEEFVWDCVVS